MLSSYAIIRHLALVLALLLAAPAAASAEGGTDEPDGWRLYDEVLSEEVSYTAVKGDTLLRIAGRLGVELEYLLKQNPRETDRVLPGDTFRVVRRNIVPAETFNGIVINIPDRMLYLFRDGSLAEHYPVGLGKPDWQTPRGTFEVLDKHENPTWYVPVSIQKEMAAEGRAIKKIVPPGPDNPLGHWALKTTIPGVLIHETNAPETVFGFRSHGCIRMRGDDAGALFGAVARGDSGMIIYSPVKLAVTREGAVYLEVHKDVYARSKDPLEEASRFIRASGLGDRVDWQRVNEVAAAREGVAEDISLRAVRSADGQEEFSEGGAGAHVVPGPRGGTGKAGGNTEHPEALQHAHRGVSDGDL